MQQRSLLRSAEPQDCCKLLKQLLLIYIIHHMYPGWRGSHPSRWCMVLMAGMTFVHVPQSPEQAMSQPKASLSTPCYTSDVVTRQLFRFGLGAWESSCLVRLDDTGAVVRMDDLFASRTRTKTFVICASTKALITPEALDAGTIAWRASASECCVCKAVSLRGTVRLQGCLSTLVHLLAFRYIMS